MKNKKQINSLITLCILLIICVSLGLYKCVIGNDFMASNTLLYFTVQSNILVLITSIIYLIKFIVGYKDCRVFNIFHLISTIAIFITFIVFSLVLIPNIIKTGNYKFLFTISNITLHFLSPILSLIIFAISPDKKYKKYDSLYGVIFPILYLMMTFAIDLFIDKPLFEHFDGTVSKFPYFFLDYHKNGFFTLSKNFYDIGIFYYILMMVIPLTIICFLIPKLNMKKH